MVFFFILSLFASSAVIASESQLSSLPQDVICHKMPKHYDLSTFRSFKSTCKDLNEWMQYHQLSSETIKSVSYENFKKALSHFLSNISDELKEKCPHFLNFKHFFNNYKNTECMACFLLPPENNNVCLHCDNVATRFGWENGKINTYNDMARLMPPVREPLSSMSEELWHTLFIKATLFDDCGGIENIIQLAKYNKTIEVNKKNKDGNTALMFAIKLASTRKVALLLKNGADMYLKNDAGMTALAYAQALCSQCTGELYAERKAVLQLLKEKNWNNAIAELQPEKLLLFSLGIITFLGYI